MTEVRARLRPTDKLYAFLDDIYGTGPPEHTDQFHIVGEALRRHAHIHVLRFHLRPSKSDDNYDPIRT